MTASKSYFAGTHRTVAPADTVERPMPLMADFGITSAKYAIPVVRVVITDDAAVAAQPGANTAMVASDAVISRYFNRQARRADGVETAKICKEELARRAGGPFKSFDAADCSDSIVRRI